jgi:hypothetical protein
MQIMGKAEIEMLVSLIEPYQDRLPNLMNDAPYYSTMD